MMSALAWPPWICQRARLSSSVFFWQGIVEFQTFLIDLAGDSAKVRRNFDRISLLELILTMRAAKSSNLHLENESSSSFGKSCFLNQIHAFGNESINCRSLQPQVWKLNCSCLCCDQGDKVSFMWLSTRYSMLTSLGRTRYLKVCTAVRNKSVTWMKLRHQKPLKS